MKNDVLRIKLVLINEGEETFPVTRELPKFAFDPMLWSRELRMPSSRESQPAPRLVRVLGDDRRPLHRFREKSCTDLEVFGIREEAIPGGTIRKPDHEDTIDVMSRLSLKRSSDSEIVSEFAACGIQQGCDFRAILIVLLLIDNEQTNSHFEGHRTSLSQLGLRVAYHFQA